MTTETEVYRKLQEHLDKMPVGYPPTKSGVEINLLKAIFTPKQARIATHLDYKYKTVDQIFETAKGETSTKEELKGTLDEITSKGGIRRRKRRGKDQYALIPLVLWGMYEQQLKRLTPEFLGNLGPYLMGEFGIELAATQIPKMRVIPVEKSIKIENRIATYDELHHLIEQAGDRIAIQECICKKVNDLQGKSCQVTERREGCLSFGDLADLYVNEGWGRKISQEEALSIAQRSEEEGLVLMPGNEQEPEFMCTCCNDCCGMLSMIKNFPRPAEVIATNYTAQVDRELCKGHGICAKRCPMNAIVIKDELASIDLARCIGCGLCIPTCPENAIRLVNKTDETIPPKTEEDLFDAIVTIKKNRQAK